MKSTKSQIKHHRLGKNVFKQNIAFFLLSVPAIVWVICFHYLPMFGVVISFKDYNYADGIFGSPWVGLKYFEYFFSSKDVSVVMRNTLSYQLFFLLTGQIAPVFIALCLYEVNKKSAKAYQTMMIMPHFISWVLVAYIVYALLSHETGIINSIVKSLGGETIMWYSEPKYWPVILVIFHVWKSAGMSSVLYYATLCSIDSSLFEAAAIDGANRFKQIIHISIPGILPIVCVLMIMAVGGIMGGDFGLFYQLPRNSGALYSVTDIMATYTYRLLQDGNLSYGSAIGLFQSVVGSILVLTANKIVKKINPENAMF